MTDSLRTRIAAVQQEHHLRMDPNHPAWGYCRCGLNVGFQDRADEPVPEFEWWVIHARHVADAVIRELNLAKACESGCMWQIPSRFEDMTPQQRKLLGK